jgi:hypothetical protein
MVCAGEGDPSFLAMKVAAANFFVNVIAPEAAGLAASAMGGAALLYAVDEAALAA